MTAITVRAQRLSKRYGALVAVDDVSFTARAGDIVGLLGPNGSGKTTIIRILTTIVTPTGGDFVVAGIASERPTEIRRRVGVLAESSGYPEHQTGQEYLRYHARLHGMPRADATRAAARLLTDVGLAERGAWRIFTYSRGMRQRLGIARALINAPDVVFLDEPTLGLDPAGQQQVLQIVRDIAQRRGATVVLSTHMLAEVEQICTSVVILDQGRVLTAGTVTAVTGTAAPSAAQVRVPVDLIESAIRAVTSIPGLIVRRDRDRPQVLRISRAGADDGDRADGDFNLALQALVAAQVPILSYEIDGIRLSDAFLALTRKVAK